jgi:hypothetical protein
VLRIPVQMQETGREQNAAHPRPNPCLLSNQLNDNQRLRFLLKSGWRKGNFIVAILQVRKLQSGKVRG